MAKIIWTEFAAEDLQNIYDFIARDSVLYAGRFIDQLIERVDVLIKNKEAGRIVPEFENPNIRELIEGSYRIIYQIRPSDVIGIVRIHHSAKLLNSLL